MLYTLPTSILLFLTGAYALPQWGHGYGGSGGGSQPPCSAAVVALATGIHLNIQGQYAEYNGTVHVINIETASPVNQTAFYIAKGELLSDIQAGMNIRQFNQEIAPAGNAALPGLAKYQAAQQTEQGLAMGLTGVLGQDQSALSSLKSDIMAGIKLNENNLQSAVQGCELGLVFPDPDQSG
ncbi:hypothetical protein LTR78_003577 [Recurvomyces mirabilis]|uniref:Uncharacterized protein n=1 Tax=Recurvomyces mirabilis TaxID=574656 RepID=A0AAE0WS56_9PEZI|nr:hypothetical protein LTR78_003577 [Recurvomyces mirabilis]KAK5154391.1 hypothetical protein LTS14_006526 [Recurvomyces mirabilis]